MPAPWEDPRNFPDPQPDQVTAEPGETVIVDVMANDRDPRGRPLRMTGVDSPGVMHPGPAVRFTVPDDFQGRQVITYTIENEAYAAKSGELTVIVDRPRFAWTNTDDPLDVNDDGLATARDALAVINFMRRSGGSVVAIDDSQPAMSGDKRIYPDVNEDGSVSGRDATAVINHIERN
jgi:hypothetical protein